MPTASDGASFPSLAANSAAFKLGGGRYNVALAPIAAGSAGLQALGPDGVTWLAVHTALTIAGFVTVDVGPGQYRFGLTGASGVFASVYRVPS